MLCSPSALIQSICSQQIRRRLRPERSSLPCRGILGREKRGPGTGERCQGLRHQEGLWRRHSPGGTPQLPVQRGRRPPQHSQGHPLPALGAQGLFPSPRRARGVASSLASHRAILDGENYCSNPQLLLAQEK